MFFITFLSTKVILGQQTPEKNQFERKLFLGFSTGPLFSKLIAGSENDHGGLGSPTSYKVTFENKYKTGFNAGLFAENHFAKHFAFQSELNYLYTKHEIKYVQSTGDGGFTDNIANFTLANSLFQLSFLPKLILGKKNKIYFLVGPAFNLKIFTNINGTFEKNVHYYPGRPASYSIFYNDDIKKRVDLNNFTNVVLAAGANFPLKDNFFCAEFRLGQSLSNIISAPNMKEIFATINILYKIKLKK